jgi:hypothetical protein
METSEIRSALRELLAAGKKRKLQDAKVFQQDAKRLQELFGILLKEFEENIGPEDFNRSYLKKGLVKGYEKGVASPDEIAGLDADAGKPLPHGIIPRIMDAVGDLTYGDDEFVGASITEGLAAAVDEMNQIVSKYSGSDPGESILAWVKEVNGKSSKMESEGGTDPFSGIYYPPASDPHADWYKNWRAFEGGGDVSSKAEYDELVRKHFGPKLVE